VRLRSLSGLLGEAIVDYVLCPECHRRIDLDDEARSALEERRGREWETECVDGHAFCLHDGVMTTRLQPNHYNVFWHIQGIESGQESMRVGEWRVVRPRKPFEEIDEIRTICYPEEDGCALPGVRSEGRFDNTNPSEFWIMTSGYESEWGQRIRVNWIVYGSVPTSSLDIWRENLLFAARQLLATNYRPCVIQSAIAVESFVYHFVMDYLSEEAGWRPTTIRNYIHGASRDSLPLQGVIGVCIEEVMGLPILEEVRAGWNRLKQMRDALAHGDLHRYGRLTDLNGQLFAGERDRAEFAYRAAVRFIYEIRYPSIEERPTC
jgi:hypothetical protein